MQEACDQCAVKRHGETVRQTKKYDKICTVGSKLWENSEHDTCNWSCNILPEMEERT